MTSKILQRPGKIALTISLLLPLIVGCTTTQAVDKTSYSTTAAQASFSEAQLDSLLAPIALYPDTVLSHVLIASTYPLEVVEADRWASNNTRLKGDDAVNAVDNKDWDPSVKALVAFPDILQRMSDDLDWTQQLGDAFLASEERVMDSIQKLRNRAYASGSLDKVEHVRVVREEKIIMIEPSVERVVYVPAYDTRVVYGNWWWADYPPVYWHYPSSYVFVSGFYWGPRVYIGPRFYFSGAHWHQRRVYVVDHHHHHRFYDSRSVVRYSNAKHWHHNPVHRRGVAYYDNNTRDRFHSPRESYSDSRQYRAGLDGNGNRGGYLGDRNNHNNSRIAPNAARDQRQGRDDFQQRLDRRQAGQITTNSANVSNDRPVVQQPRAEQLRERMNNRNGREQGNLQNRTTTPRTEQRVDVRQNERRIQSNPSETRSWDNRANTNRVERTQTTRDTNRIERVEQPNVQQQNRTERPMIQRIEQRNQSAEPVQRVDRQQIQRVERQEQPRVERIDRSERMERAGGGGSNRTSDNRGELRGGRER
ncbi:MAG: DUF3300 domain-containing protein [Cellvibrio sp.]|uniref:DUF3300 domain-containing protein n=1 Tax=Cellvibrio sp. TaxID=1965322 RepID=UPI0031A8F1E7